MANFNIIARQDPSDLEVKLGYLASSTAGQLLTASLNQSLAEAVSLADLGKVTDFVTLQLICVEEAVRPEDTAFSNKQIHFKTDYPQQFLFISTKILTDPLLSQSLVFNGIKCDQPDVIRSVEFIDSANKRYPPFIPTSGMPFDQQIQIDELARIEIDFNIKRRDPAFNIYLRIKGRTGGRGDFYCDPQVGNDPPLHP